MDYLVAVDCTRTSDDRYSPECQERSDTFLGAAFVLVIVLAVIAVVSWWLLKRRFKS